MNELLDERRTNSGYTGPKALPNASASLVLGIISIATCWLFGIPGLVCGIIAVYLHNKDKSIYMEDPAAYEASFKNSKAGFICGVVGLSLSALAILYWILYSLFIGAMFSAIGSMKH